MGGATRRAIFAAIVAAAPTISAAKAAAAGDGGNLARLLREHDTAVAAFCASNNDCTEDGEFARIGELREAILDGAICGSSDAAAKLKMAVVSFDQGELANGKDEAAVHQVIHWLEAR